MTFSSSFDSFHLNFSCANSKCAVSKHIPVTSRILTDAKWVLLASPASEVNSEHMSLISNFLAKEDIDRSILTLSFTYDNIGKVNVLPLVEEMGWFDPKYVSGPVVIAHYDYIHNFENLIYTADESLFWYPVVKSVLAEKAKVVPFPSYFIVSHLSHVEVISPFEHHDLHRKVLFEFDLSASIPWRYQELLMALTSAVELDTAKTRLVYKLERIFTRILFPPGTVRRALIIKALKALKWLG